MTWETWLIFAATEFVFAITPGPAMLLVIAHGLSSYSAGFRAALGVQAGNAIYFVASAAGIGALLAASPTAFTVIRYAGAAYLIYMGVRTIVAARAVGLDVSRAQAGARPFRQALVNQLANPKSIIFFGAFFPQFIRPEDPAPFLTLGILGISMVAIELPVLCVVAYAAARGGALIRSPKQILWRERASGAALVAVGATLAVLHN